MSLTQFGFLVAFGVLLETFVVRSILVPALTLDVGRWMCWPSKLWRQPRESRALEIPDTYGVDDIPLIIQDKRFDGDGSLDTGSPLFSSVGILGDEILVNGTHAPYFEATAELVRLRVLNASNARVYNLGFSDNRKYSLIGADSGLGRRSPALNGLARTIPLLSGRF